MTILFTTDHYLPTVNGIVTHVCLLRVELEKRGHTVYIVTQKFGKKIKDPHLFYLPSIPFPIRAKDPLTLPFNPLIERKISKLGIDIIHNHLFFTGLFGLTLAKENNIPIVVTYHTFVRQYVDWFIPWAKKVTHPTANWLTREYFRDMDAIIAPSAKAVAELTQAKIKKPIHLLPNGIELKAYKNNSASLFIKKFHINTEYPLIIIVGALETGKNIDIAIRSMRILLNRLPHAKLAIIGDGKLRKKLELLIKRLRLEKHIFITGFLDAKMVASANKAANIVLFTSDTDNFPTVLIEAIAAHKPIVAVKDTAIEDLVKDHQNGLVVKKNPVALATAMRQILTKPSLCASYGEQSGRIALQFSIQAYVDRLETLYKSIIQDSSMKKST